MLSAGFVGGRRVWGLVCRVDWFFWHGLEWGAVAVVAWLGSLGAA